MHRIQKIILGAGFVYLKKKKKEGQDKRKPEGHFDWSIFFSTKLRNSTKTIPSSFYIINKPKIFHC